MTNILSPQKIKTGLLQKNYIAYQVVTRPFDYIVRRRFNDFVWLRDILQKEYPGFYIPPLPEKGLKRSFQEEYLLERMKGLQIFLEQISEHPEIKASIYMLNFLKCKSQDSFEKMKKDWSKHSTPVSNFQRNVPVSMQKVKFTDFLHADGCIRSQINPNLKVFSNSLELLQTKIRAGSLK